MLKNFGDLKGSRVDAIDGEAGTITDLYFDDLAWTTRYLVVDTGGWLSSRKVLIDPATLKDAGGATDLFICDLPKDMIANCPPIEEHVPVSREREMEYRSFYGWPYYWSGVGMTNTGEIVEPGVQTQTVSTDADAEGQDANLRSMDEVTGYHIQASDDLIGHADDFIVDTSTWQVRYLVIDTSNWWIGKKVILPSEWIESVSWGERRVYVPLTREAVKNGPEWNGEPLTRDFERALYEHHGRIGYWNQAA